MKRLLLPLVVLVGSAAPLAAQSFFTTPAHYLTPGWRGSGGTEFSHWDVFYAKYNGLNYPDFAAPNGLGQTASAAGFTPPPGSTPGNPYAFWHAANPTLTQTGTPTAFIIGPSFVGNIYSFAAATAYQIADATPFPLGSVVMQFQTDGALMDFDSIRLVIGGTEYAPTNFITEHLTSGSPMGGITNRTAAQWNLTGLGATSYAITFHARTSSNSFQELLLDTTPTYAEAVPSARTWSASAGLWSAPANWSGGTVGPVGGNIVLATGTGVIVDGSTREIGELKLSAPGAFAIGASGGGVLKINTGITATPTVAASYVIDAPVEMGAYNLTPLNAFTTLAFNAPISGATGLAFSGAGTMRLNAANTFTGSLSLDGGILEISGTNSHTGSTAIFAGSLVVQSADALGSATSVALGSGGTFGDPEAALLIEGAHTVSRAIALSEGADAKKLGGRDTGTGAVFSGDVTLNSTASNVRLHAENLADEVTFSGAISGGGAGLTLTKTGAGTVVFSGGAKTFLNDTIVAAGTLRVEQSLTLQSLSIGAGATVALAESGGNFAGFAPPASSTVPEPSAALLLLSGAALLTRRRFGVRRQSVAPTPLSPPLTPRGVKSFPPIPTKLAFPCRSQSGVAATPCHRTP